MDFLFTDTPNNQWQFCARDLSLEQEQALTVCDPEIVLSLEQVAPLLKGVEIPVLAAQRIHHRSDLRALTVPYPCHIQVPGKEGIGITVANRIDAIAACQTLFSRKVNGAFPAYLLVEEDYSQARQLSLGIVVDESSGEITIWGKDAQQLGARSILDDDVTCAAQIYLTQDLETEDGLNLASQLNLDEAEADAIACLFEQLYLVMTWTGVTSCCLDALALGQGGEVMALRGQFKFGMHSPLKRQAQAAMKTGMVILHPTTFGKLGSVRTGTALQKDSFIPPSVKPQPHRLAQPDFFASPEVVRLGEGNIAVISNDSQRTMTTLEHCQRRGGSVAAFVNLQDGWGTNSKTAITELQQKRNLPRLTWTEPSLRCETTPELVRGASTAAITSHEKAVPPGLDAFSLKRQLCQALQALDRLPEVKVILINWRSAQLPCRILADALMEYQRQLAQQARRSAQPLSLVVRLTGKGAAGGYQRLKGEEIETEMNLDGAIARSIGLARMGRGS